MQEFGSALSPRPGRAEFRAEALQKKRQERLEAQGSVEELEEHRRLMAWNDEENARQRARRSAQPCPAGTAAVAELTPLEPRLTFTEAGLLWAGLGTGSWWGMVTIPVIVGVPSPV